MESSHLPAAPPMQEVYPAFGYEVQTQEDGSRLLMFRIPAPNKVIVFPMTAEGAAEVGTKLAAPSVVMPPNGRVS